MFITQADFDNRWGVYAEGNDGTKNKRRGRAGGEGVSRGLGHI